jgi:hypothetical protein
VTIIPLGTLANSTGRSRWVSSGSGVHPQKQSSRINKKGKHFLWFRRSGIPDGIKDPGERDGPVNIMNA